MLLFAAKNRPFTEIVCRNRKITARNRFRAIDERNSFLIQARLADGLDSQSNLVGRQDREDIHSQGLPSASEAVAKKFGHEFDFVPALIGGAAIDATGEPLPAATVEACQKADAV